MEIVSAQLSFIVLFPLLGSVLAFIVGKQQRDFAGPIATVAAVCSFAWVLMLFLRLPADAVFEHSLFRWMDIGNIDVDFLLRFDRLSAVMCLVVTGVGSLIHLYSVAYMAEDEGRHRFFSYLNLFLFAMLLLVLGGNMLVLFVGWEGVGLCSYLLIGFWFKNAQYAAAGRKAFVVNRIGDGGFLIAMFLIILSFGTIDFAELAGRIPGGGVDGVILELIAICLFIGAAGKSAQLPLFVWLPDAMAGPTPVSALIHAATMVTAGVYMVARLHFLYDVAPLAMAVITVVAALTAFIAGTTALAQNDIKKVLAYSTVSQLGFMFLAAGAGAYAVAIFHVVTHAFFKACLFLGAGSVIHGCHHEQDMRHMGGLAKLMPITAITYIISTLAIAGIFPFAGYQSKHAILVALQGSTNPYLIGGLGSFVQALAALTAFVTAFYMTRSVALTFFGAYRGHAHPHESPLLMTLPLMILGVAAIVGGLLLNHSLLQYLAPVVGGGVGHAETVGEALKHTGHHLMDSWVGILGVALALLVYLKLTSLPAAAARRLAVVFETLKNKYYLDEIYGFLIIRPLEKLAAILWRGVDQGCIDGAVNGVASVANASGEILRFTQTGQVRQYALLIFAGTIFIIAFYIVF